MIRYLAKRVGSSLLTLFLFVTFLFFVVNLLVPGDWTSQFILTGEQREALRESVGLDRSLWDQYWTWITGLATLNLGQSFAGFPVWEGVRGAMASTLFVFLSAMAVAFPVGNWIGRIGAWRGRGWFLGLTSFVAIVFFTVFPPSLAFLLRRGLTNTLSHSAYSDLISLDRDRWLLVRGGPGPPQPIEPAEGYFTVDQIMWRMTWTLLAVLVALLAVDFVLRRARGRGIPPPAFVASVFVLPWAVWRLAGWQSWTFDLLGVMALLIVGIIVLFYGELQLVTEAAMEDAVDEDFVLTARAKGMADHRVRDRHAARIALLPVFSRLVVSLPYFLTGLAILEEVFGVGGLGSLIFGAIRNQDTPVVVGAMTVVGALSLVARLILDLLYAVLDPRIRYGSGRLEVDVG